jgi:hypothetical protein
MRTTVLAVSLFLAACGGGGGGSSNTNPPPAASEFPTLVKSATFSLPALAEPPQAPQPVAGLIQGRVHVGPGEVAPAGTQVELIDATGPNDPVVLAAATTDSQGRYQLSDVGTSLLPARRWVRATLPGGTVLRAYARPVVDVSPGTEAAVLDITRIDAGSGIGQRLSGLELQYAQELASLHAEGLPAKPDVGARVTSALHSLLARTVWTRFISDAGASAGDAVPGDIGGVWPIGAEYGATITETTNGQQTTGTATLRLLCQPSLPTVEDGDRVCSWSSPSRTDLNAAFEIRAGRIVEFLNQRTAVETILSAASPVAWMEFPPRIGTEVLYENPRVLSSSYPDLRAALKVVRRTYPIEGVQALGRTVRALRVVVDYELAIRNSITGVQLDLLERESLWLAPSGGVVRVDGELRLREAAMARSASLSLVANTVDGGLLGAPRSPIGTPASVVALPLEHRHAIYSAARNRVYVALATASGGAVLEKDPATLQTLRQLTTSAVPGRLAVSSDGARLYAGFDGGTVAEYLVTDFSDVRSFSLPLRGTRGQTDRVTALDVDPLNPSRILAVGSDSRVGGGAPGLSVFVSGALVLDALAGSAPGAASWSGIHPSFAAWSNTPDEFVVTHDLSPASMYRLRATAAGAVGIATLDRAGDTGFIETAGEIVTQRGRVLRAGDFSTLRELAPVDLELSDCSALGTNGAFCKLVSGGDTYMLLSRSTGRVLAVFNPQISTSPVGCADVTAPAGTLGVFGREAITPMGSNRVLVSAVGDGRGRNCTLQSWLLIGQP